MKLKSMRLLHGNWNVDSMYGVWSGVLYSWNQILKDELMIFPNNWILVGQNGSLIIKCISMTYTHGLFYLQWSASEHELWRVTCLRGRGRRESDNLSMIMLINWLEACKVLGCSSTVRAEWTLPVIPCSKTNRGYYWLTALCMCVCMADHFWYLLLNVWRWTTRVLFTSRALFTLFETVTKYQLLLRIF